MCVWKDNMSLFFSNFSRRRLKVCYDIKYFRTCHTFLFSFYVILNRQILFYRAAVYVISWNHKNTFPTYEISDTSSLRSQKWPGGSSHDVDWKWSWHHEWEVAISVWVFKLLIYPIFEFFFFSKFSEIAILQQGIVCDMPFWNFVVLLIEFHHTITSHQITTLPCVISDTPSCRSHERTYRSCQVFAWKWSRHQHDRCVQLI